MRFSPNQCSISFEIPRKINQKNIKKTVSTWTLFYWIPFTTSWYTFTVRDRRATDNFIIFLSNSISSWRRRKGNQIAHNNNLIKWEKSLLKYTEKKTWNLWLSLLQIEETHYSSWKKSIYEIFNSLNIGKTFYFQSRMKFPFRKKITLEEESPKRSFSFKVSSQVLRTFELDRERLKVYI